MMHGMKRLMYNLGMLCIWPPKIASPPPLPFQEAPPVELALDEAAVPPEPPEFTPSKLKAPTPLSAGPEGAPAAVVFDPKNPNGRTRGDAVLHPTNDDRTKRIKGKRFHAAVTAGLAIALVTTVLAELPIIGWIGMCAGGSLAGWLAYDRGHTEVS